MKDLSKKYFEQGYNCCEAVIMAANEKFDLRISKDSLKLASCISNGMGVGSLCSAIIGGTMVIGYLFEEKQAPEHSNLNHIRISFINDVHMELKSINCSKIIKHPIASHSCSEVISTIADILEKNIIKFT